MSNPEIQNVLATPMELGECPVWDAAGAILYWVDIPGKAVHRLHPASGAHAHWPMPTEPGCIALQANGGLIVALRSGLAHLDTDTGMLRSLLPAPYETGTTRFNDGRCDAAGRLWVGTIFEPKSHAGASLFCFEHGQLRDVHHPVTTSNGVAFSCDGKTLYHADTPAHRILAYDYDNSSGQIGAARLFHQFPSDKTALGYGGRPDGAAVDSEDAYWCAMFEGGRLLRLSRSGEILQEVPLPVRCPTMIAFGGNDLRTLYITTGRQNRSAAELAQYPLSGHLLSMRVAVPGCREFSYVP
ncbi:MAG: gluconolactonase [Herbaspirillum sp.]|nr:gluconolactonase [Herbaspirillum sp.]